MRRLRRLAICALVALAAAVAGCGAPRGDGGGRVRLVTTTSTANSGLLAHLLAPFREETGTEVVVVAVGTGQALTLGARGDADLVLVHARGREDAFVAAGHGVDRRDVMWNDFVIVGPPEDPAGLAGLRDASAALGRVRAAEALFVSRGDDSGTHIRERDLWRRAAVEPLGPWYWKAGQGMGRCLVIADEKRAYTLTDRGTYLAFRRRLDLAILVEGDAHLRNPYGAMLVDPARHEGVNAAGARALLDYLTSARGQARIAAFRVEGEVLFHPAASG